MDNNFLLTYSINGRTDYSWFELIEEIEEFVRENIKAHGDDFVVNDTIEILSCREIKLC